MHSVISFFMHASPLLIYIVVFVILALESTGIPIANNTLLLFTGALASMGHLNIWLLTVCAIVGSVSGACCGYMLGWHGGRRILFSVAAFFHIDQQKVQIVNNWFQRSGTAMIFFSRMTPYVRPFACFPAGIAHMPFHRFLMAALTGSIIWCISMLAIGWLLGKRWSMALHMLHLYTIPVLGGLFLIIALYILAMYIVKRYLRTQVSSSAEVPQEQVEEDARDLLSI